MGAGKTSVGRALARRLHRDFVDLDDVVVSRENRSIADIFRDSGEPAFRQAEAAALRELLSAETGVPRVVALGGGAFVQNDNACALRAAGATVVFLDAEVEELRRRCASQGNERPLFQDGNQFRQLYEARRAAYIKADIRIETTGLTVYEAAAKVARTLGLENSDR
jgi:shikimate kinase